MVVGHRWLGIVASYIQTLTRTSLVLKNDEAFIPLSTYHTSQDIYIFPALLYSALLPRYATKTRAPLPKLTGFYLLFGPTLLCLPPNQPTLHYFLFLIPPLLPLLPACLPTAG